MTKSEKSILFGACKSALQRWAKSHPNREKNLESEYYGEFHALYCLIEKLGLTEEYGKFSRGETK